MDDQPQWMNVVKKLPTWISGTISLVTALTGFVLFLRGQRQLGLVILAIVGVVALLVAGAYVASARTPPLVGGGRGVYRFEKYRPWALIGIGFVLGFVTALLLSEQNRTFVLVAFLGSETPVVTSVQTPAGAGGSARTDAPARPATSPSGAVSSSPPATAIAAPSGDSACFAQFFSDVPPDRIKNVEVGAPLTPLIGPSQPKNVIFALKFTAFNQPLGAMKLILFPENEIFKVVSLVDANCQEIEAFSNTAGGDKHVLSDGDGLQMRFGDREYVLQLIYDSSGAGEIWLGYFQSSPP